jgi:hypothetical protein
LAVLHAPGQRVEGHIAYARIVPAVDLVTFAPFEREKRERYINQPAGSQVWHITKIMKALEHATDSTNNRAAFKRAALIVNPQVIPLMGLVDSAQLNGMIEAFT